MALNPPVNLNARTKSDTRIMLTWASGAGYDYINIYRTLGPPEAPSWNKIDTISGELEHYNDTGLTAEENYCYKVTGETIDPEEESGYSNEACAETFAELGVPSDIVATAVSDTEIDVIFKDNAKVETLHRLQRKVVGDGGWVQIVNLEPNREFYRDTTAVKGVSYTYQVRAEGPGGPTADVESDPVTTIEEPSAPTLAVILATDIKDKSIRLRWTDNSDNETGFRIEKSDNDSFEADEGELIAVVGADVTDFLVTGLTPGTPYWFRIRAYNAAGYSDYSDVRTDTTDDPYEPTEFEKWIRDPNIEPVYLAEIYLKMTLDTFTATDGKDKTFQKTLAPNDRGIDILEVFEGNEVTDPLNPTYVSYTKVGDADAVQATAKTFHFHYASRTLYVHTSDDTDPDEGPFLIEAAFWLYFSTHKDIEFTANGRLQHFLPLLAKEDIPDITQEIKPYFEGSFAISSGSIAFKNAKIGGEHFFDKKFATYTWINSKVILKAGRSDFTYDLTADNKQFKEIFTACIDKKSCSDAKITFQLRDTRKAMSQPIALRDFTLDEYPGLIDDEGVENKLIGKPIPISFGINKFVVPVAVDIANGQFKFNDHILSLTLAGVRSKSVEEVRRNGAILIENTHYYIDLQRSQITFNRDGAFIIEAGVNDEIDFNEGNGDLNATLTPGTYTTDELLIEIRTEMRAAGTFSYLVTCSPAPERKFKIYTAADVFSLLWKTGTNGKDGTDTHVGTTIGFADDEDSAGEESYEADKDVITIKKGDIIEVSFTGFVNSADEIISNGAEIFKYLMNNYKEITDTELNLDSIYASKAAKVSELLSLHLNTKTSFNEIVRTIEHSLEAYTFQDEFGKLGIRPQQTTVASNVKYIISPGIFSHSQSKDRSSLFWKTIIYYNKDSQADDWESKEAQSNVIDWKYRIKEPLEIYTYFRDPAHAQNLATSILSLLNKEGIDSTLSMLLFDVMAGDLIKFSRVRFYNSGGTANEITLRVIRISKSPASGRTSITAETI